MFKMNNFKNLVVWQKSIELAVIVYDITSSFPTQEKYGLVSQMNRSAVSVASNIAEGAGRNNTGEFYQFLGIANGSISELETQAIIAQHLKFISDAGFNNLSEQIDIIQKLIYRLKESLKSKN
jgi:four helix bundle protein